LNPRLLSHEPSILTTRPWLLATILRNYIKRSQKETGFSETNNQSFVLWSPQTVNKFYQENVINVRLRAIRFQFVKMSFIETVNRNKKSSEDVKTLTGFDLLTFFAFFWHIISIHQFLVKKHFFPYVFFQNKFLIKAKKEINGALLCNKFSAFCQLYLKCFNLKSLDGVGMFFFNTI
jgi:hypothetical protein